MGHGARTRERRGAYKVLVGKPEGRRPLVRPKRRWEANIKMGFQEVKCGAWTRFMWPMIGAGGGFL